MMQQPRCTSCGSEAQSVFCVLAGAHLERIEREKTVHNYQRGEAVFYAGNPPLAIFCIYSGRVKLLKVGRKGEEQVIRLLGSGEILGYRALLSNEPYAATAEALEPTTICMISKATLMSLIRKSPELAFRLMAKLGHELRVSEEQLISRTEDTVRERVAQLLLWLGASAGKSLEPGMEIRVPLRRAEMAQMIGTTPETLSRTLKSFAKRGTIELTRTSLRVLDPNALSHHARNWRTD